MRYRKLTPTGDMRFGHGGADFWFNQVDGVGQAIRTRLLLFRGEWFLDKTEGMPWGGLPLNDDVVLQGQVLGKNTERLRDMAIQVRVLGTPGVLGILNYSSEWDGDSRTFSVNMTITTIYGGLSVSLSFGSGGDSDFVLDVSALDSGGLL